jgi:tetratricopeptide (TPR) repeat protein
MLSPRGRAAFHSRPAFLVPVILSLAAPLAAQVAVGDSAWTSGDYPAARAAYERALAENPHLMRANFRLGILLSWEGKLDSSLTMLRRARDIDPDDADLRYRQALVMSWHGDYRAAILRYDSLLAQEPQHHDAKLGRARALSWAGRLHEAGAGYEALVKRDPGDIEALTGLAQVTAWQGDLPLAAQRFQAAIDHDSTAVDALVGQANVYRQMGRVRSARRRIDQALALQPTQRDALDARALIDAASRPDAEATVGWSHDSDRNTNWWQTLTMTNPIAEGIRGFATVGLLLTHDPTRTATRSMAEAGASYARRYGFYRGALGLRHLSPDGPPSRTPVTGSLSARYRFAPPLTAGVAFAHFPFDETAQLVGQSLDLDVLDLNLSVTLGHGVSVETILGSAWFSDGNYRQNGIVAATKRLPRGFTLGALGRIMSFDRKGIGYFSPDRFTLVEGRGGYYTEKNHWDAYLGGGLGAQRIGSSGASQVAWHVDGRVARHWAAANEVAISAGASNSAASSTTGAYRYYTVVLSAKIGL